MASLPAPVGVWGRRLGAGGAATPAVWTVVPAPHLCQILDLSLGTGNSRSVLLLQTVATSAWYNRGESYTRAIHFVVNFVILMFVFVPGQKTTPTLK